MLQDCPGEKQYQSHKLLTFQIRNKKTNSALSSKTYHFKLLFWSIEEQLSVENPGLIHPWIDRIVSFSDLICIGKLFKYIQNIQHVIHDADRIPKWKVLLDLLNHVRTYYFSKKSKNRLDQSICLTFLYRFLKVQESLGAQYKEWRNASLIHNEKRNFA